MLVTLVAILCNAQLCMEKVVTTDTFSCGQAAIGNPARSATNPASQGNRRILLTPSAML